MGKECLAAGRMEEAPAMCVSRVYTGCADNTITHVLMHIHGDLQIGKPHSISTFPFSSPSKNNNKDLSTYVVVRSHKIREKKGNLCVLGGLKNGAC